MTKKRLIKLTHDILYSYYTDNKLEKLFTYMADDIVWLGAGDDMKAEGRLNVSKYFLAGQAQMFPCEIIGEEYSVKMLGTSYCLVEETARVSEKSRGLINEGMHNSFIYRRVTSRSIEWEIVHLNNSITWKKVGDDELFACKRRTMINRLSDREYEIALQAAIGLTNKEIAGNFGFAEITVKKIMQCIYQKMETKNRVELANIFSL